MEESGELWNTTNSEPRKLQAYLPFQFAWYSFIFTLGVIGNLYITLAVICRKEMGSTTNYFILNLAVSDLGILVVSLPAAVIHDYFSWPFGKLACQILIALNDVFFSVSICTITVITLERYRAIVMPFKSKMSVRAGKLTIALIWLLSYLIIGFPMSFHMEVFDNGERLLCLPKWPSPVVHRVQTCLIGTLIVIPLFITAYAYIIMIKAMKTQSKKLQDSVHSRASTASFKHDHHRHRHNAKLFKMLIIIVVVFWICMSPLTLLALIVEFFPQVYITSSKLIYGLFTFFVALFFSNSAFNPVAIYIMSSELRKGINVLLFYKRRHIRDRSGVHV